jgi:hypothetical protein
MTPPRCKTALGCPIEDLATNRTIYLACIQFMHARALLERTGLSDRLKQLYASIDTDLSAEAELEQIWIEYKNQAKSEEKPGWKKSKKYQRTY